MISLPLLDQDYDKIVAGYQRRFIPRLLPLLRDLLTRRQYRLLEYFITRAPSSSKSDIVALLLNSKNIEILPLFHRVFPIPDPTYLYLYGIGDLNFYRKLLDYYKPLRFNWPLLEICKIKDLPLLVNYLRASFDAGGQIGFAAKTGGAQVLKILLSHIVEDEEGRLNADPLLENIWNLLVENNFYLESFTIPDGYLFLMVDCYLKKPNWLYYLLRKNRITLTLEDITFLLILELPELINRLEIWDLCYFWVFTPQIYLESFNITYTYPLDRRIEILRWLIDTFPGKGRPVHLLTYISNLEVPPPAPLLDELAKNFIPITPTNYFNTFPSADIRGYYELRSRIGKKFILDGSPPLSEPFTLPLDEVSDREDLSLRSLAGELQELYAVDDPLRIWDLDKLFPGEWIAVATVDRRKFLYSSYSIVKVVDRTIKDGYTYLSLSGTRYWKIIQELGYTERYSHSNYYEKICPKNEIYFIEVDGRPHLDPVNTVVFRLEKPFSLRLSCKIVLRDIEFLEVRRGRCL